MTYDITFQNVTFSYAGSTNKALQNINLYISPGEIVLITGPAGSGKTTLCSCINGLVPHYHEGNLEGEVLIGPYNTKKARVGGLASIIGMVFQDPEAQLVTNSVMDEVAFGPENLGIAREEINERTREALQATRLVGYEEREPHNLSGGEQQACCIAATYAMRPEIYVMDEPLANLDPAGRAFILKLIIQVAKQRGKTLIIVEHALEETLPLVDRVIIMNQGQILREGPTAEILAQGDIPHIFKRPDLLRLAEKFQLPSFSITPQVFANRLRDKYTLKKLGSNGLHPDRQISSKPVIELQDVSFSYNAEKEALHNVSLTINAGEMVAILGRNGSGKTTLVRHVIGLHHPTSGKVLVNGMDVAETPTHILAQDVGFCFQNPNHQIVTFNVRDEMTFGLKAHNIDPSEYEARIHEALRIVDLSDYIDTEVFDLVYAQASISLLNRNKIVKEIKRILKPEATLCVGEITALTNDFPPFVKNIFDASDILALVNDQCGTYYTERNFTVLYEEDLSSSLQSFYEHTAQELDDKIYKLTDKEKSYYKKLLNKISHESNAYLKLGANRYIGFKMLILKKTI